MENKTNDRPTAFENEQPSTNVIPIDSLHHKKGIQRKMPPHMRRLNMRFSSPSDNLSPMSQKLMLSDRNNAALKTITPKSLFASSAKSTVDSKLGCTVTSSASKHRQTESMDVDMMSDGDSIEACQAAFEPPSPTKGSKSASDWDQELHE